MKVKHKRIGRTFATLSLLLAALIGLSGCGKSSGEYHGVASESVSESQASSETAETYPQTVPKVTQQSETTVETTFDLQSCTVEDITFWVDSTWEHMPREGYEGTYVTPDQRVAYQLQGISVLGSYTPEEFYKNLMSYYQESYTVLKADDTVEPFVTADGLDAYVGQIQMTARDVMFSIDVLIVPQKNTVVTFAAQCAEGTTFPVDVREVTSTAVFDIGTEDTVSGNTFLVDDGSRMELGQDDSFIWYQAAEDPDSAYCTGTYEVYYGQAALDKVSSMTEYGLTAEELKQTIASAQNGYTPSGSSPTDFFGEDNETNEGYHVCVDTFYAIILYNEQLIDGAQTEALDSSTLYIGYYLPELELLDLLNANTANYTQWTLQ